MTTTTTATTTVTEPGTQGSSDVLRARPLRLGDLEVEVPVVLAPMAGVTNVAFRRLCAEQGAGLYVCEMITSRGLVEGDATSLSMLTFADNEPTTSPCARCSSTASTPT